MKSLQKPNSKTWKTYLNDREFRIVVMKKLNDLQENSERQFNELRYKINKGSTLPKRLKEPIINSGVEELSQ